MLKSILQGANCVIFGDGKKDLCRLHSFTQPFENYLTVSCLSTFVSFLSTKVLINVNKAHSKIYETKGRKRNTSLRILKEMFLLMRRKIVQSKLDLIILSVSIKIISVWRVVLVPKDAMYKM